MEINTFFEQGEKVKEIHTSFIGTVRAVESMMTGIQEVDEASQCYLVERDVCGIADRRWIRKDRLEKVE